MTTIAWLMMIIAIIMLRQVSKGRIMEMPVDLRDIFVAGLTGDTAALKEIASRTGTGLTPDVVDPGAEGSSTASGVAGGAGTAAGSGGGSALISEMRRLGASAGNRYVWGGTSASGFDCSGLVWRALVNLLGAKKVGGRFTTATFGKSSKGFATPVATPQVGDVVVWNRSAVSGHMGVVIGPDRMYSALGKKWGILESKMSTERGTPMYYRITG